MKVPRIIISGIVLSQLCVFCCIHVNICNAQIGLPVEAHNRFWNTKVVIRDDCIEFLENDTLNTGYVKINNYRNINWPEETNIGFDRYEDYWIAGEFSPAFSERIVRSPNINLIQLYHSVYVQFAPNADSTMTHRGYFTFGFHPWWGGRTWITARTQSANSYKQLKFNAGDHLRYIVRMIHDTNDPEYGMDIWVKNLTTGVLATDHTDANDHPNWEPPDSQPCPIYHFYIGSGSHGFMYCDLENGRETFWGKIFETLIGQARLTETEASNWLNNGTPPNPAHIVFDLNDVLHNRETLIPMFGWQPVESSGARPRLTANNAYGIWDFLPHEFIALESSVQNSCNQAIRYYAAADIHPDDLTRRYISFSGYYTGNSEFNFYVKVEGDNGREKYILFSTEYLKETNIVDGDTYYEIIPLNAFGQFPAWNFRNFQADMKKIFNKEPGPKASSVSLKWLVLRGYCFISDILLSNNPLEDVNILPVTDPQNDIVQKDFIILQNYPNPFNPSTTINFKVLYPSHITIKIFNTQGQEINVLMEGLLKSGHHQIVWDGEDDSGNHVSSGTYFLKISNEFQTKTMKLLLLR